MTLEADVQQGWHDAIVELFDIDLEPITGDPQDKFYFTNQLKPDDTKIQWKGNVYEPLPILSSGYEKNTTGQIAQPSLTVSNVMGTFTQVIDDLDDLVGGKVTRRRTFGKYLDGEPEADPTQEFPIDIFFIERKTSENELSITWQLSSILDLEGLQLPRRVITQNYCQWKYRSSECGYTGVPILDSSDKEISPAGQSAAAIAVINAYNLVKQRRQEAQVAINNRNAAAANKEAACTALIKLETRYNSPDMVGVDYYVSEAYTNYAYGVFGGTIDKPGISLAKWNNTIVALGDIYRRGSVQGKNESEEVRFFSIERWGVDATACSNATAALSAAESALTTASNNLVAAQNALTAAIAALPASDPLRSQDVCGKRVGSCRLHFPAEWNSVDKKFVRQALPFGGFPGAILGRQ